MQVLTRGIWRHGAHGRQASGRGQGATARRRVTWAGRALAALCLLWPALRVAPVQAAVPTTVLIQGVLLTKAGGPTTDGDYSLTFALYAAESGGTALWTEAGKVTVQGGEFVHVLGSVTPLPADIFGSESATWFGLKVAQEPELPRRPMHAVAFARRAALADAAAFPYAGSKTKGGPATDLQCSGCVGMAELSPDGDLDLGGNALKAKQVSATGVTANTVTASSFVGDGSKLTGISTAAGQCKVKGEVVKGINPDGSLQCVASMDANALPADGLDEISNGLLSNQYLDQIDGQVLPIQDNNPTGVSDSLDVPDLGLAQQLDVAVDLSNSDISKVTIWLFDPNNVKYVLYEQGAKGTGIKGVWPSVDKAVQGDLTTWVGKNPKGKWRLQVIDVGFKDNKFDGQVNAWSVRIKTLSSKKVEATGKLITSGGLQLQTATKEPVVCDATTLGYMWVNSASKALQICNGKKWYSLNLALPDGSQGNPATSCDAIHKVYTELPSGTYWLDSDGASGVSPPYKAWCDMTTKDGGWTLAMHVHPADGHAVTFTNTTFWTADAEQGAYADHFNKDYKGPAAWLMAAKEIMVQVADPGDTGKIIGWKAWTMSAKTFDSFFHAAPNSTQTNGVSGQDVAAVYAYEPIIKNGNHLQSNRLINPNSDRVRLGVDGYPKQGDDNQPGLGTQMNESICGAGNNCYRYRDVELWVNTTANLWCEPSGEGTYPWIGTDGGCGGSCGNCDTKGGPPYKSWWTYRIYVR